jgi:hypothetical protein
LGGRTYQVLAAAGQGPGLNDQKSFGSFLQKRTSFLKKRSKKLLVVCVVRRHGGVLVIERVTA